jgi:putative spermidine/putrescine transport system substrate-binding protein
LKEANVKRILRIAGVVLVLALAPALLFAQDKPVKLSIIDVAGNLRLSRPAIEAYKAANPNLVTDIELISATAPELVPRIKAQQMAGNVETTMALTGYDGIAAGKEQGVWLQVMPKYKSVFQKSVNAYLPGAKIAYNLFDGYGIAFVFCPGGPMFTYNPDKVAAPPKTAAELLAWAKANPNKFMYARPANSGPGRCFLQGLPYILKDSNPKDPKTWTKTWAYLKELDNYIEYYPSWPATSAGTMTSASTPQSLRTSRASSWTTPPGSTTASSWSSRRAWTRPVKRLQLH